MSIITTKTLNLSFTSKILIILCLIITIVTLSYFIINDRKSISIIHFLVSSSTTLPPPQISLTECHLSLNESDGWFCELDSDWKRRKVLHHIQDKRNRISDTRSIFFQNNWEPTIQCEFERRLGNTGDGGKWVCDIYRFEQMNNTNLLIYSFGSNGDFSFERAIKEQLSKAEIHTFDMGSYKCPDNLCTFHQARLGNGKNDGSKSLQMVMKELGHEKRQIHLLKVDIEGSEFNLFEELFDPLIKNQTDVPYIRQILFEIHLGNDKSEEPCRRTHKLFELFRSNNYAIFHKEVEYTLSSYEQNPYAGVLGDVSYRYYSRLFKTLFRIWVPNVLLGYSIYTWANWEYDRCIRKLLGQFADEKPLEEENADAGGDAK